MNEKLREWKETMTEVLNEPTLATKIEALERKNKELEEKVSRLNNIARKASNVVFQSVPVDANPGVSVVDDFYLEELEEALEEYK